MSTPLVPKYQYLAPFWRVTSNRRLQAFMHQCRFVLIIIIRSVIGMPHLSCVGLSPRSTFSSSCLMEHRNESWDDTVRNWCRNLKTKLKNQRTLRIFPCKLDQIDNKGYILNVFGKVGTWEVETGPEGARSPSMSAWWVLTRRGGILPLHCLSTSFFSPFCLFHKHISLQFLSRISKNTQCIETYFYYFGVSSYMYLCLISSSGVRR